MQSLTNLRISSQTKPSTQKPANIQEGNHSESACPAKVDKVTTYNVEDTLRSADWSHFLDQLTETRAVQNCLQSAVDDWDEMQVKLEAPTSLDMKSVAAMATTEGGSRKLQEWVLTASNRERKLAWKEVVDNALICDTYGNIFVQKLMETASPQLMESILAFLEKHLTILAHDRAGCWVIQKAIESETIADQWLDTLSERNLADLIVCKHGHYVVQKLIEKASVQKLASIENIFRDRYAGYSIHEYGYHVTLALIDHASVDFRNNLMDSVMRYFLGVSKHKFGNFVVGHLMVTVPDEQKRELGLVVLENFNRLCFNDFGSFVVEICVESKCLDVCVFMEAVLRLPNDDLVHFLGNKCGNYVAQKIIEMATVEDVARMRGVLQRRKLRSSVGRGRGKHVIRAIKRKLADQA